MNLNAIRKRIEALENVTAARQGDGGELLSPDDVAILLNAKAALGDSEQNCVLAARIDELLAGHQRAAARIKPEPMSPADANAALLEAAKREEEPAAAERHHRERLAALVGERNP